MANLYRKMVDENLVRKDLSFGEMANLALAYAREAKIDSRDAVGVLYASALKQKRTYIRQFARILEVLGGHVRYPEAIPRALGLELYRFMDADFAAGEMVQRRLESAPRRDPEDELQILRSCAAEARALGRAKGAGATSKTSLKISLKDVQAKVTAEDGRLEVRMQRDFSSVNKERLEKGIAALLCQIE